MVHKPYEVFTDAFVGHVGCVLLAPTLEVATDDFVSDRLLHTRAVMCSRSRGPSRCPDQATFRVRHGGGVEESAWRTHQKSRPFYAGRREWLGASARTLEMNNVTVFNRLVNDKEVAQWQSERRDKGRSGRSPGDGGPEAS